MERLTPLADAFLEAEDADPPSAAFVIRGGTARWHPAVD